MIPKNKRFSLALVLLMCLTLCLTALSEGDTEEVSITIFDENGEVVVGETPEPEVTPEPTVDPSLPVYEADGSILLTMTFAGDMTIGSNVQSSGTSIFEKELEKQKGDINFPFRNVRDILLAEERVPSTNELAKLYAITPATAAKGVNLLVDEGILYKKRGIGMFVVQGAKSQITAKRRKHFYDDYVKSLMAEAVSLGITKEELIEMIRESKDDGE